MKAEFREDKRMQLLAGSKVKCIKSVEASHYFNYKNKFDFIEGEIYTVPFANNLHGLNGSGHTWDIGVFREYFIELPPVIKHINLLGD